MLHLSQMGINYVLLKEMLVNSLDVSPHGLFCIPLIKVSVRKKDTIHKTFKRLWKAIQVVWEKTDKTAVRKILLSQKF